MPPHPPPSAWQQAWQTLTAWLPVPGRLPRREEPGEEADPTGEIGADRVRAHRLVLATVRHYGWLEWALGTRLRRPPRPKLRALLFLAGAELREADEEDIPKVVDHAVNQARRLLSPAEAGLVNAVLRQLPALRAEGALPAGPPARRLAIQHSHPEWMVERWLSAFGPEDTARLLEWDQAPAPLYVRAATVPEELATGWEATAWPGFWKHRSGDWAAVQHWLATSRAYLMDPFARVPVELLAVQPGEKVLDLCAAPGGKSFLLAEALQERGVVLAFDKPGPRFRRLESNFKRTGWPHVRSVSGDLRQLLPEHLRAAQLPAAFDAVLLDAPCSNTGVLRRRPDAKWRMQPTDLAELARLQAELLAAASRLVRPSGRLAYSTCSLESEENEAVVEGFLRSPAGTSFRLGESRPSRPWQHGHDGGGAFLLVRA